MSLRALFRSSFDASLTSRSGGVFAQGRPYYQGLVTTKATTVRCWWHVRRCTSRPGRGTSHQPARMALHDPNVESAPLSCDREPRGLKV